MHATAAPKAGQLGDQRCRDNLVVPTSGFRLLYMKRVSCKDNRPEGDGMAGWRGDKYSLKDAEILGREVTKHLGVEFHLGRL
jgi:hypothetical protein